MKKYLNILKTGLISTTLTIFSVNMIFAATFKDVSESYWAYSSIERVVGMGVMYGDSDGKFDPEGYIDKFDTSKIFARLAGYKTDATKEELDYYEKIYQNKKNFIEQFNKEFTKWNSSSDKEIAYLLEKGIMTDADLNQFIIRDSDGTEQLRALSREEAAVFLVRIMGKEKEAKSLNITKDELFSDDSSMSEDKRPHIYYLKRIGIVTGASENVFKPKGAATKATVAYLIDNILDYMEKNKIDYLNQQSNIVNNTINIESQTTVIDKIFPSLSVLQLNVNDTKKLYRVSSTASIKIDGNISQFSSLKEGMVINIVLSNSEIIQIEAASAGGSTNNNQSTTVTESTTEVTTEITTEATTQTTTENTTVNKSDDKIKLDDDVSSLDSATLSSIRIEEDGAYIIAKDDNKSYNYPINTDTVDVYSLRIGDNIKIIAENNEVIAISVNEQAKSNTITGYVRNIKDEYMVIEDINSSEKKRIKVYFDEDTLFVNSSSGKRVKYTSVDNDMKVYVLLKNSISNDAKSITILSK